MVVSGWFQVVRGASRVLPCLGVATARTPTILGVSEFMGLRDSYPTIQLPSPMPPRSHPQPEESLHDWLTHKLAEDKKNGKLDWSRAEEANPRDKRCRGPPCLGNHKLDKNGRIKNNHMVMYRCTNPGCGIRLLYVPAVGSHGATRQTTPLEHLLKVEDIDNRCIGLGQHP